MSSGPMDKMGDREATGVLTNEDKVRLNGKLDHRAGKAKDALEAVKDAAEDVVDKLKGTIKGR